MGGFVSHHKATVSMIEDMKKMSMNEIPHNTKTAKMILKIRENKSPKYVNLDSGGRLILEKTARKKKYLNTPFKYASNDTQLFRETGNLLNVSPDDMHTPAVKSERIRFSPTIKQEMFMNHNGNVLIGTCFVCAKEISYAETECGHVISLAAGGTNTVDNLRPVCGGCNRNMGTMNMLTYKLQFAAK